MPVRLAIIKRINIKCWSGCGEKKISVHCWWDCKPIQPLYQHLHVESLKKRNQDHTYAYQKWREGVGVVK